MRSLAAQLVALALAVPVSTVSSSMRQQARTQSIGSDDTSVLARRARASARAYCQARIAAPRAAPRARPHRRAGAPGRTARAAAAAPRLAPLVAARAAGRAGARARTLPRPGAAPLGCASPASRPGSASTTRGRLERQGRPYWGGLQMDRGFMRAYGSDMIRRHHGGLADTWTPAEQILVAERAYATRGFAPVAEHRAQPAGSAERASAVRRASAGRSSTPGILQPIVAPYHFIG